MKYQGGIDGFYLQPSVEEIINAYKILVGKSQGKGPLVRLRRRWEDNIKEDLETRLDSVDCITLAQDRDQWRAQVTIVLTLRVL
jgi:hypothetical protein